METKLILSADVPGPLISKHIYGHFAEHLGRCIYEGLWVGEDSPIPNVRGFRSDVVNALRNLRMPNLRWPGGCFADTYHWMDGIGPREKRPSIVNIHWGGVTENNHVGTHEFFDLCEQLSSAGHECEPYICGNVGSGTVREMAEWLEYITMPKQSPMADLRRKNGREEPWKLKYWAVGNENWGCGGNMRPQYYADLYRRYGTYCRNFGGDKLYKIACGFTEDWNQLLLNDCHKFMDGLSIHYYSFTKGWTEKGSATEFSTDDWFAVLKFATNVEPFLVRTSGQMDRFDSEKRIGIILDEWGTWFEVEPGTNPGFLYQQNTIRDALVAGLSFNIFNRHAGRLHMANIAQTVNVLQAMVLTEGAKMVLTPTYHVFEMFKKHQDAALVPTHVQAPDYSMDGKEKLPMVNASASRAADGKILLTLCNLHHDQATSVSASLRGVDARSATARVLKGDALNAMNTFEQPGRVGPAPFDGIKLAKDTLTFELPSASVLAVEISA